MILIPRIGEVVARIARSRIGRVQPGHSNIPICARARAHMRRLIRTDRQAQRARRIAGLGDCGAPQSSPAPPRRPEHKQA
eukprot:4646406-Pyramimonas_sp.AAC.1